MIWGYPYFWKHPYISRRHREGIILLVCVFFFIVWPYKVAQTVQFESYRNINVWWIYLQT